MIILDSTQSLEVKLGENIVGATQLPITTSWVDMSSNSLLTPGTTITETNNTTYVSVVAAPSSSNFRQIKYQSIYNIDSVIHHIYIRINNGSVNPVQIQVFLSSGDALRYDINTGFEVLSSSGFQGATGPIGFQGATGTQGTKGFQGYQGTVGATGTQGHGVDGETSGTAVLDFGVINAERDSLASVFVADTSIQSDSSIRAWLSLVPTADHSLDEIIVDPPMVSAGNIQVGVGFTIYGYSIRGTLYGDYNVFWVWY